MAEVRGGLPYMKPELIKINDPMGLCEVGRLCDSGKGADGVSGTACGNGTIGPTPDPRPKCAAGTSRH